MKFSAITPAIWRPFLTCHGHLRQRYTVGIISICCVTKTSKYISDCRVLLSLTVLIINFANVNDPLIQLNFY